MHAPSLLLLIGAAGMVAILHSILPDHWVPLAVVARTQRWSLLRVGRITFLASLGHVLTSLVLGGIIALVCLQFQQEIDTQQGHIVGAVLVLTGLIFLVWSRIGRGPHGHQHGEGHTHTHSFGLGHKHEHAHEEVHTRDHGHEHAHTHEASHEHDHESGHEHTHDHEEGHEHNHVPHEHAHEEGHEHNHAHEEGHTLNQSKERSMFKRLAAIAVPFGVAASPDLTILPVVLAASAVGRIEVVGVLSVFTLVTILTFIGLTIVATIAGYQIKGAWLEKHATTITSLVLIAIGVVAFVGF
jgi:nickel/cobalt transporter (NicO) family protein